MDVTKLLEQNFPHWDQLSEDERKELTLKCMRSRIAKGEMVQQCEQQCKGLLFVISGELRTFIVSDEGREITLFRIDCGELCVLTASCLMDSLVFDVLIDALEDTEVLVIPSMILQKIMKNHMEIELFMYKESAERFSDVIWMLQQILFLGVDQRVARFIWDECNRNKTNTILYTQEEIARLIGSAREVVSRVLKFLATEKIVELSRGKINITDKKKLQAYIN